MEEELTSKEICKIIDMCAKSSVESIQYGTLKVVFDTKPPVITELAIDSPSLGTIPQDMVEQNLQELVANDSIEQNLVDEKLEELFLTDPFLAEQLAENGELEDAE